jgi:hypothetical protein
MTAQIYSQLSDLFVETATFYSKSSVDKYNKPTFSSGTTITGRFMNHESKTRDANGVEVIELGKFICKGPHTELTVNHKMVVDSVTYTINDVSHISDENGVHHTTISFGR